MPPLLSIRDLKVDYRRGRTVSHALRGVSLDVSAGECVGIVGESGCGKSTLARAVLGLVSPVGGDILFEGRSLLSFRPADWTAYRRRVQPVFQDSLGALDPRQSIGSALLEAVRFHRRSGDDPRRRVHELLDLVDIPAAAADRYPHELSGGQRQRVALARAIAVEPSLLLADEPVSALDVSIQAGVIHLLDRLRRELGLAILFIAHDLAVVRALCPFAHVLHDGVVVERGPTSELFTRPREAYTRTLLDAVPDVRRALSLREAASPSDVPPPLPARSRQ